MKESGSWVKREFPRRQDAVDLDAVRSLEKQCGAHIRELSGTLPKVLVGGAIAVAAALGTGGVAAALAPDIAVGIFGGSFVGLHGAALVNASLAAAGGGALAAGGMGMAGGTALIAGGGAAFGLLGSSGVALAASMGEDYAQFVLVECSRLLAFLDVATDRCPHEGAILVQKAAEAVQRSIAGVEEDVEKENGKGDRRNGRLLKQLKKGLGYLTSTLKQIEKMQKRLGAAGASRSTACQHRVANRSGRFGCNSVSSSPPLKMVPCLPIFLRGAMSMSATCSMSDLPFDQFLSSSFGRERQRSRYPLLAYETRSP